MPGGIYRSKFRSDVHTRRPVEDIHGRLSQTCQQPAENSSLKGRERGCARAACFKLASFSPNSGKFRLLLALSRGTNQIPACYELATRDSELETFVKPSPIDSNDYTRVSFLRARVVKARRKFA